MSQVERKQFFADGKQDGGNKTADQRIPPLNPAVGEKLQEGAERQ